MEPEAEAAVDVGLIATAVADDEKFDETFDVDIEKVEVGSYKSAVAVVVKLLRLKRTLGETWDDRDMEVRSAKAAMAQQRGKGACVEAHHTLFADELRSRDGRPALFRGHRLPQYLDTIGWRCQRQ